MSLPANAADIANANAIAKLAIARGTVLDEAVTAVYLDQLADCDPVWIARACDELAKQPRREYETALPDVGTIRERAERLAAENARLEANRRLLPLPADADEPTYFCLDCRDESSGWRTFWCFGGGALKDHDKAVPCDTATQRTSRVYCGRKAIHAPHFYVEKCGCYATNPVIARRRELARKPAEATA